MKNTIGSFNLHGTREVRSFWFTASRRGAMLALFVALIALGWLTASAPGAAASEPPLGFLLKWGTNLTPNGAFNMPEGVAVDAAGNVYVADTANNRIQKFTSTGTFLTKWGYSGTDTVGLSSPNGVAVDGAGNVYVADSGNNRIEKFTSTGVFVTMWGWGVNTGASALETCSAAPCKWGLIGSGDGQFNYPTGLSVDGSGNVYVVEANGNRVQKFSNTFAFLTKWGSSGAGDGEFSGPRKVSVDGSGNVYVIDTNNNRVQKFNSSGTLLAKWGSRDDTATCQDGKFNSPWGIGVDSSGNVYVADSSNICIQKFDSSGNFLIKWGTYGTVGGQLNLPDAVALDSSGNVYVADAGNYTIQKYTNTGTFLTRWGASGTGDGQFMYPRGMALDGSNNIYVTDNGNSRIEKFTFASPCPGTTQVTPGVCFVTKWGSLGSDAGQFNNPNYLGVDASGNVYVADTGNNRIEKFTSSGAFVTMWGWGVLTGANAFETCSSAPCNSGRSGSGAGQFRNVRGLAVDSAGNVYTTERRSHRVQKFTSSGVFLTMWGWGVQTGASALETCSSAPCKTGLAGSGDGEFNEPRGIAVSASGDVYVADTLNARIEKFSSTGTFVTKWGFSGHGDGQFGYPTGVATDPAGNVYVVDARYSPAVQKFTNGGTFVNKWGMYGNGDGQLAGAWGIAVDGSGKVYIGDSNNWRVQKFGPDNTPPSCALTAVIAGPPKQVQITCQDTSTGLSTIIPTSTVNCTIGPIGFYPGTMSPVIVTATKIDQAQGATFSLSATDVAGNVTLFDPVFTVLSSKARGGAIQTFEQIPPVEHWVTIQNGAPGLTGVDLLVNSTSFKVTGLKDNETKSIDIGSAMGKGKSRVTLTGLGKPEASAIVIIAESPIGATMVKTPGWQDWLKHPENAPVWGKLVSK